MAGKKVEDFIISVIERAVREIIPSSFSSDIPSVCLEIPKNKLHGDLSCNIAMRLVRLLSCPLGKSKSLGGKEPSVDAQMKVTVSRRSGKPKSLDDKEPSVDAQMKATVSPPVNPEQLGRKIVEKITEKLKGQIERIEVYPSGFINFFFSHKLLYNALGQIEKKKSDYGRTNSGRGKKIQIEFVSANPTGPLSVAHGRQAAVGDSLANILEFSGFRVNREYYLNDEGTQIDLLGESIKSRAYELLGRPAALPQGGYQGEYVRDVARAFLVKYDEKAVDKLSLDFFSKFGCQYMLKMIKNDLKEFGVKFDLFFSQTSLRTGGKIKRALNFLERKGLIYDKEGARWFKSTQFGDDKDRVVVRSNGDCTYFTPDIAYHRDKFGRNFKKIINIWGPDHHGYIPRLKAAVKALGFKEDAVSIIIVQLVTLLKGKEKVQMSTRAGKFLTLREITREVGRDAARFFFVMRRTNSHLDFDLELAKETSLNNPVYYIQYAHARISSILEFKKKRKKTSPSIPLQLELLNSPEEMTVLKLLRQFPQVVALSSQISDPYNVVNYIRELAGAFHAFYAKHRVVTENLPQTEARVLMVKCVRIVLANGLKLLGISAPKKM